MRIDVNPDIGEGIIPSENDYADWFKGYRTAKSSN